MEDIKGPVVTAPCGHPYDVQCLVDLVKAATVDETLFPPACCQQPFDFNEIWGYLDGRLRKQVERKIVEFGTKNRVYCREPTCSTFIGAATPSPTHMLCTTCWAYTCGHCKGPSHDRSLQCMSTEDEDVIALAEESGWKRCPSCGQLVELLMGCNHMTCRCRHQFCYVCTAPWKTCRCDQWNEDMLLGAARRRVNAQQEEARRQMNARQEEERHQAYAQQEEDSPSDEEEEYPGEPAQYVEHAAPFYQHNIDIAGEAERLRGNYACPHYWQFMGFGGHWECFTCGTWNYYQFVSLDSYIHAIADIVQHLPCVQQRCARCLIWQCPRCSHNRWM